MLPLFWLILLNFRKDELVVINYSLHSKLLIVLTFVRCILHVFQTIGCLDKSRFIVLCIYLYISILFQIHTSVNLDTCYIKLQTLKCQFEMDGVAFTMQLDTPSGLVNEVV
jgi:hypothetical protein